MLFRSSRHGAIVVNAGTTMTVDALSRDGVFLGGVIVPGLALMRTSLDRGTAQLRLQDGCFVQFPDNTADAIMSGAVNALLGAIERMWNFLSNTGSALPVILLSGGAAPALMVQLQAGPLSSRVVSIDNLVLDGLLEIARDSG